MSRYPSTCQIKSVNCDGSNVASGMEQDAWSWGISQSRLGGLFFSSLCPFFPSCSGCPVMKPSFALSFFFQTLNSVLSRICLFTVHRATMEVSRQDEITITFGTGKITGQCYQDQICARWPSVWLFDFPVTSISSRKTDPISEPYIFLHVAVQCSLGSQDVEHFRQLTSTHPLFQWLRLAPPVQRAISSLLLPRLSGGGARLHIFHGCDSI